MNGSLHNLKGLVSHHYAFLLVFWISGASHTKLKVDIALGLHPKDRL